MKTTVYITLFVVALAAAPAFAADAATQPTTQPASQPTTQPATQPADEQTPAYWLGRAEASITEAGGDSGMAALMFIALYTQEGDYVAARRLVAASPEAKRDRLRNAIAHGAAWNGDVAQVRQTLDEITDAEKRALTAAAAGVFLAQQHGLYDVATEIAETLPQRQQSWVLQGVVKAKVVAGDVAGAKAVAEQVRDENYRIIASEWVQAGEVAQLAMASPAEASAMLLRSKGLARKYREIVELLAERGQIDKAVKLLAAIPQESWSAGTCVTLAEACLDAGRHEDYRRYAQEAAKRLSGRKDEPIFWIGSLFKLAQVQIEAGDFEEAKATLDRATAGIEEDAQSPVPIVNMFGGRKVVVFLHVKMEQWEKAWAEAHDEEGNLREGMGFIFAEILATDGQIDEAKKLLAEVTDPGERASIELAIASGLAARAEQQKVSGGEAGSEASSDGEAE